MYSSTMRLKPAEKAILEGGKGEALAKAMESVVRYGEVFGATELLDLEGGVHLVTSFGLGVIEPVYKIMDELIAAGLTTPEKFTADPRPMDFENVGASFLERLVFKKIMYSRQAHYEAQLKAVGLKDEDSFSCACYFDEVGNKPKAGQILAWAESSAVVYANSVLGARTNRNSGVLELLCGIVGKAPNFGLLTDSGRRASWVIEVRTSRLPEAQILGSAIGLKVVEEVPYIQGLDKLLGPELDQATRDWLKDFGAAAASNGAVGLFHVEGLTPEAKDQGRSLVREGAKTYVIDDAELERVRAGYPTLWKDPSARPDLAFIGCPHLSMEQLEAWVQRLEAAVRAEGRTRLGLRTILTTAPGIEKAFRATAGNPERLEALGASISSICPLMYLNNPLCGKKAIVTSSNKLRTYTKARYFTEAELVGIAVRGTL